MQKEKSIGNPHATHLFSRQSNRDRRFMMERFSENLYEKFSESIREKKFNFYVVEIEASLSELKRFHQIASHHGKLSVFLIECNQPEEIIQKNSKNQNDFSEIKQQIEEMKIPLPKLMTDLIMLDASGIYERDRLFEKVNNAIDRNMMRNNYSISAHKYHEPRVEFVSNSLSRIVKFPDPEDKQQVKESMRNHEFAQLIKSSFLGLQFNPKKLEKEKKPSENYTKNLKLKPDFTPRSTSNHSNKIKTDQYVIVENFRPVKIFEYEHKTTEKLLNLLCEDLDQLSDDESDMEVEKETK